MPPASPLAAETAAPRRWLSIVGIGEDGAEGLSPLARGLIADAEIVFGGKRHLELAASLVRGAIRPWPSPFDRAVSEVVAQRGRQVCVLASGDPFFYGVGALLARHVDPDETIVMPAPSAFSLAAARLGWPLPETTLVSLHGRPLDLIRPHLHPGARILVLTADGTGPEALAALLSNAGFGASRLTVLESLGGSRERVRAGRAAEFALPDVTDLNLVALEVEAASDARITSRMPGLPDAWFEHDGQITKREIRALTLSALTPRRGELLWDIGAGAGSVAIEWMLSDVSMRAVAIETRPDRAARIRRNAAAFGVPGLDVVEGRAPQALGGLPMPQAIFVGGGATEPGLLDTAVTALPSKGRLVVNAVTLETEALLIARHAAQGGDLIRVALSRAEQVGSKTGWAAGDAGDAMGMDQAMIVAGVGCRAGASARDIEAAIAAALDRAGLAADALGMIATSSAKGGEPGIAAAASGRGVTLVVVPQAELKAAGGRVASRSERVLELTGVPSLAEAAALAAAGPSARLVAPRVAVGPATCALAITADAS